MAPYAYAFVSRHHTGAEFSLNKTCPMISALGAEGCTLVLFIMSASSIPIYVPIVGSSELLGSITSPSFVALHLVVS